MTQVSEEELSQAQETYFIPHKAVVRPENLTTKLWVVFDASAKTTTGSSLNNKLWPRPNLQKDFFGILIQNSLVCNHSRHCSDVSINISRQTGQLILWRKNSEEYKALSVKHGDLWYSK